jgi:hypothetical protein
VARAPDYPALAYRYYLSWGIAPCSLYNAGLYAVVLFDLATDHIDSESILDCSRIAVPAIR